MTSFRNPIRIIGLFLLFPLLYLYLRGHKKFVIGAILSLAACFFIGCFQHYYTKDVRYTVEPALIERLRASEKIFIGHFQDSMTLLFNLRAEKNQLLAESREMDYDLYKQANTENLHRNTYSQSEEPTVPSQVHIYLKKSLSTYRVKESELNPIPYTDITQIEIFEKDKAKDNTSKAVGIVGVVVGSIALTFLLIAIICNCPQVYVEETGGYVFKGGMYSGAILSTTERTDHMVLDNFPVSHQKAQIRIDNVKGESQHINQLKLLKVDHPEGSKVLTDRHGRVFSYRQPVTPSMAYSGSGKNITGELQAADGNMSFFDDRSEGQASKMTLRFPASFAGHKARLILHGYNTGWAGYLNQQFQGYFGRYYDSWRDQQENKDPKNMEKWMMNQSLPVKVSILQTNGSWKLVDYLPLAGNTAMRKYILELDIPKTNAAMVDIKLETVYNFWQIDYAALDASAQTGIVTHWLTPDILGREDASTAAAQLAGVDAQYLVLRGSESLQMEFRLPKDGHGDQTYFLSGTGYYHQSPSSDDLPDIPKLVSFRKPGSFHAFSLKETAQLERGIASSRAATRTRQRTGMPPQKP